MYPVTMLVAIYCMLFVLVVTSTLAIPGASCDDGDDVAVCIGVAVQLGSQCIFTRKPRHPRVTWLACEVTLDQLSLQAELP